jgi:pyruvate kinase
MRRTRILATLGPASCEPAVIADLIAAGADAFRLNFSHGTHEEHGDACRRVRAAAAERPIAVLQDLGGPKIRTGPVAAPIALAPGDALTIARGQLIGRPGRVSCASDALFRSVTGGARLLVDDGLIELRVEKASADGLETRVVVGGLLGAEKGINLPGAPILTSAVTPKDEDDLRFGLSIGVDAVALSFVQSADDVRRVKAIAASAGAPDVVVIAKIERPQAIAHLEEILDVADGLMVARGDLGIEVPLETLPALQKRIVAAARARGVPVIVATEVLESMRHAPRPTRAEVTDAAHAVDERADVIMLSGETAAGDYPVRTVETLAAIIGEAERASEAPALARIESAGWSPHARALGEAAVTLAAQAKAAAIVAVTTGGNTARLLAALRPDAAIVAATPNARLAAQLSLVWGVTPIVCAEASLEAVRDAVRACAIVPAGAAVVYVSIDADLGADSRNYVRIERDKDRRGPSS